MFPVPHAAAPDRYETMHYRRCGASGLMLPAISLGLWHNFGHDTPMPPSRRSAARLRSRDHPFRSRQQLRPAAGSSPRSLRRDPARPTSGAIGDEMIISSKAGYLMWPGPYGEWGSRKYLIASCDQSLKRMGLDYVDIFYSHRFDPDTPLEETMGALDHIVRSGRALYAGISSYNSARAPARPAILKDLGTPCLIHQPSYNILNRWVERDG
jgi:L-glyceraldehyde 3-phosphate reductase